VKDEYRKQQEETSTDEPIWISIWYLQRINGGKANGCYRFSAWELVNMLCNRCQCNEHALDYTAELIPCCSIFNGTSPDFQCLVDLVPDSGVTETFFLEFEVRKSKGVRLTATSCEFFFKESGSFYVSPDSISFVS
jgi:hypothetical protein